MSQFFLNFSIKLGKQFTHYAKGTPLFLIIFGISTAYRVTNSQSVSLSILLTFQNFPSQYFPLSLNLQYLALEDGSPIFQKVISHCTLSSYNYFITTAICSSV
jgi:hypothetical protein